MRIERFPELPDVCVLMPEIFLDERGRFLETYRIKELFNPPSSFAFVQGNVSYSSAYVLRGLHYQTRDPQGKLIRCISGRIYDVAVDMREGSPTLGRWAGTLLDDIDCRAMWVPPGFAHGFLAVDRPVAISYDCTSYYQEEFARTIKWDDPDIGVTWPTGVGRTPILSGKDIRAGSFRDAPKVVML